MNKEQWSVKKYRDSAPRGWGRRGALLALAVIVATTGCAARAMQAPIEPTAPPAEISPPFFGPRNDADEPIWGVRDGIMVGLYPAAVGFGANEAGGPRGLLRIGYEDAGRVYFINFIALSPVTRDGRRGASELDDSPRDHRPGIIIKAYPPEFHTDIAHWESRLPPPLHTVAEVRRGPDGVREMSLVFRCERFPNDARIYLLVTIRENRPNEVMFQTFTEPGSPALATCFLSGTWGNLTRLRDLYLKGGVVNAKGLWPHFNGWEFAPPKLFGLAELARNRAGDVVFAARPDEARPWDVPGYPEPQALTQYYRRPAGTFDATLQGLVNGRAKFWKSHAPVYGGVSFENVGFLEDFRPGSPQIFGYWAGNPERLFD